MISGGLKNSYPRGDGGKFDHGVVARAAADYLAETGCERARAVSAGEVTNIDFDGPAPASVARGLEGLVRLLESGAVFCSSHLLAHGLLIEAQARGIDVPGRIAVTGFEDQDFGAHLKLALTTVRVDREALGEEAARALLARFKVQEVAEPVRDLGFEIMRRASD